MGFSSFRSEAKKEKTKTRKIKISKNFNFIWLRVSSVFSAAKQQGNIEVSYKSHISIRERTECCQEEMLEKETEKSF